MTFPACIYLLACCRNYKLDKATKMLQETIEWRKKFEIPKLLTEFKATVALENASGKMYVRGFDKEGRSLIYMKPANENTKDHNGNIKHLVYTMERAVACMDAKGEGNTKLSLVIDYGGYTSSHAPTMKTSTETLNILQNHYPERLQCAYCIRAPFVFYAFFKMVSPFIDPVTKKKISMIKNSELGTPGCPLTKDIDSAILEASVGGQDKRPFNSAKYLAGPYDRDFTFILDNEGSVASATAAVASMTVFAEATAVAQAAAAHSHVRDIYGTDEEEAEDSAALAQKEAEDSVALAQKEAEASAPAESQDQQPEEGSADEEALLAEMQAEIDAAAAATATTTAEPSVDGSDAAEQEE